MGRSVRLGEYLLSLEGLALLRTLFAGPDSFVEARLSEMQQLCRQLDDPPFSRTLDIREADVRSGYAAWASRYDGTTNPVVRVEEGAVRRILAALPPGRALDAGCGPGRYTAYLQAEGHDVTGLDAVPEMLRVAQQRTEAAWVAGDLRALPLKPDSMDLVVCSLVLSHVQDLAAGMREIARVMRPGGRVVVSDLHPFILLLDDRVRFPAPDGSVGLMRTHLHLHADYLEAFSDAGLRVLSCQEPRLEPEDLDGMAASSHVPEASRGAYAGLPAALVWDLVR